MLVPKSQGDSRSQQDVMTCTTVAYSSGRSSAWNVQDESLLVVDLLMDHLSKVWKNLVFSLGSFLIIEHCQCSSKSKTNKQINIQNRTGLEDLATTCNFVNVNDYHLILMYIFWPHFGLNKRSPELNLSQRGYKASIEMK